MKRILIHPDLSQYPSLFHPLMKGAEIFDSSCSPEASVILIAKEGGYYLKSAPEGDLKREAELDAYFHKKGFGAKVLSYCTEQGRDWLLTERVRGEDCTHAEYLQDPKRLCDLLAERLRSLHEIDCSDCPVQNRMDAYFATAEKNYRAGLFDLSYAKDYWKEPAAEELWEAIVRERHLFQNDTLLHGDYCLPNIMLDDWQFSGFIDLGNGGVGDRHIDLFWGAWTLEFNLKTNQYRNRFLDAYGRDLVDEDKLRLIAAAEVFG